MIWCHGHSYTGTRGNMNNYYLWIAYGHNTNDHEMSEVSLYNYEPMSHPTRHWSLLNKN
jgi:hypothetical protein